MGFLNNNNYRDIYFGTGYRWIKPTSWYNRIGINYNANYSALFKEVPLQKISSKFKRFNTNINGNIQLKNLWGAFMFLGYVPKGMIFMNPGSQDILLKHHKDFNSVLK
ncbi:MAG: DUF5916 domain-containing protein [Chitinophagaceae bacterium]